jgi:putative holliday junction resolvase
MPATNNSVLALDVGEKRVGVAVASLEARLPQPLTTLLQGDNFYNDLKQIIETENVSELVIGLPRGLAGQTTEQTLAIAEFTKHLKQQFELPIHFQDEAVTSKQAESELQARGKTYNKADIDALAATYILEDWFMDHKERI